MSERSLIPLYDVTAESTEWLWPDRIPIAALTSLEGDAGEGKSTLLYDLAARVTTGRAMPFSDEERAPAGVVILEAEDHLKATVRPALEAAGADVERILVYDRTRFLNRPLILASDLELIGNGIEQVGAKLVVVDPFSAFAGHSLHSETAVRRTLTGLANLATEHAVAVVLVRHFPKQRSSNPKHAGLGSTAFVAVVRSAFIVLPDLASDSPHQHILGASKNNLSAPLPLAYRTVKENGVITLEWLHEFSQPLTELLSPGAERQEHSQLEEACYVLYVTLAEHGEPMPAKEVKQKAAEALVAERTLKRAKSKLKVQSRRQVRWDEAQGKQVAHWVWELPKDETGLLPYKERLMGEHIDDMTKTTSPTASEPVQVPETDVAPESTALPPLVFEEDAPAPVNGPTLEYETAGRPWDDLQ